MEPENLFYGSPAWRAERMYRRGPGLRPPRGHRRRPRLVSGWTPMAVGLVLALALVAVAVLRWV